jgi:hypothetical protein
VNVPVDDGEVGGADVQLRHDGNVRHQEAGNKLCDNNTFKSSHLLQCLAATNWIENFTTFYCYSLSLSLWIVSVFKVLFLCLFFHWILQISIKISARRLVKIREIDSLLPIVVLGVLLQHVHHVVVKLGWGVLSASDLLVNVMIIVPFVDGRSV